MAQPNSGLPHDPLGGFARTVCLQSPSERHRGWNSHVFFPPAGDQRPAIFSSMGTFLNPHGINLYKVFLRCMQDFRHYSPRFILEWAPPTIQATPYFWSACAVTLALMIYLLVKRNKSLLFFFPALLLFSLY